MGKMPIPPTFYSFTFLGCIGGAKLLEITHIHIILYNCFAML